LDDPFLWDNQVNQGGLSHGTRSILSEFKCQGYSTILCVLSTIRIYPNWWEYRSSLANSLKNGNTVIGLFQQMIEKTTLTFNPGWSQEGQNIDPFTDVRVIDMKLIKLGIAHQTFIENPQGPGYLILEDPDGHAILIDQHR
jgi:hypothetical protein